MLKGNSPGFQHRLLRLTSTRARRPQAEHSVSAQRPNHHPQRPRPPPTQPRFQLPAGGQPAMTTFHERLSENSERLYESDNCGLRQPHRTASDGRSGASEPEMTQLRIDSLSVMYKKSSDRGDIPTASRRSGSLARAPWGGCSRSNWHSGRRRRPRLLLLAARGERRRGRADIRGLGR